MFPTSSEFRARAREAMRRDSATLILCTLLASLPFLLCQVFFTVGLSRMPVGSLAGAYAQLQRGTLPDASLLEGGQPFFSLSLAALALTALTPFLDLGRLYVTLRVLRGEETGVGSLLARAGIWWKAILQLLWTGLLLALWSLPGLAVMIAAAFVKNTAVMEMLLNAGLVVTLVLGVRAELGYRLSQLNLADNPRLGPVESVRLSSRMMKGFRPQLFFLLFSFALWRILCELIGVLLPGTAGTMVSLLLSLVLSVYVETAVAAFYEEMKRRMEVRPAEESAREDPEAGWDEKPKEE